MSVAHIHDHGGFGPYTVEDLHAREDDGKGLELEVGWLIELSPSAPRNWAAKKLQDIVQTAAEKTGAAVFVAGGGEWEISTPAGVRKPDVFVVPTEVARASIVDRSPAIIPGREVRLAVEVISPGNGSERGDQVRKLKEYATLGIPQYWIAEFAPHPRVQVMLLDDGASTYRPDRPVTAGEQLQADIEADISFSVVFDPVTLTEF